MTAWTEAIGWALIHSIWQCAVAALLLRSTLFASRDAAVRYWAACAALLAAFGAFAATCLLCYRDPVWAVPERAFTLDPALIQGLDPGLADPVRHDTPPWIVPLWALGVSIVQLRNLVAWIAIRRMRGRSSCETSAEWRIRLTELATRMRVLRPVRMLESGVAQVPSVIGWLRPVILLPAGLLASLPAAHVEAILLHELAHIRRADWLVNLVQTLIEGLLFHHPAIWWISAVIRQEREHCCDDLAVAASGRRAHEYASALAALEESRWGMENREAAVLTATGGTLMRRIHRLLYPRRQPRFASAWTIVPLMLALTGLLFAWQNTAQDKPPSPYTLWLEEDVKYLIESAEREAFLRLRTDEERKHFIGQFWERRDPSPGTPENEFKEKHYRRIAYANERFSWKGAAGWATHRGRFLITFGPPDEIESHPAKEGRPARSMWIYNEIKGVGKHVVLTFIDSANNGDYKWVEQRVK